MNKKSTQKAKAPENPFPIVLAELTNDDLFSAVQAGREEGRPTLAQRAEHKRRFEVAVDHFRVFASMWSTLADFTPSIFSGPVDSMPLMRVYKLANALDNAIHDASRAIGIAYATECATAIENSQASSISMTIGDDKHPSGNFMTESPIPPSSPERAWADEFDALLPLIREHLPPSHPVRYKFEMLEENYSTSELVDNPSLARDVVELFYRDLPIQHQRNILNGWEPHQPPAPGALMPGSVDGARLEVSVYPSRDGRPPMIIGEWKVSGNTHPAEIRIFANTRKRDVIDYLQRTIRQIDEHWDAIRSNMPAPLEARIGKV